jgi:CDP-diacylglycerol pyrophosphatase
MTPSIKPLDDSRRGAGKAVSGLGAALLLVASLATFSAAAAVRNREALWRVVQMCRINYQITGAAFPCLEANVTDGVQRGYVILRPPVGDPDIILSPTRKISGIEELGLAADGAPNYFDMAWSARSVLAREGRAPIAREDVALAVNSALARTQDQLHIHIGCLAKDVKQTMAAVALELSPNRWRRLDRPIKGMQFWARTIGQDSLEGVNPFRLVADGLPDAKAGAATIIVVGARSASGEDDFVLLVAIGDRSHAGSDLLRRSCS